VRAPLYLSLSHGDSTCTCLFSIDTLSKQQKTKEIRPDNGIPLSGRYNGRHGVSFSLSLSRHELKLERTHGHKPQTPELLRVAVSKGHLWLLSFGDSIGTLCSNTRQMLHQSTLCPPPTPPRRGARSRLHSKKTTLPIGTQRNFSQSVSKCKKRRKKRQND
jgi:hypothetical protein